MNWLKNLWGGRALHTIGFLIAVAAGALVDWKTPSGHLAIWVPLGIAALTDLGGITGKFDAAVLNPRVRNLLLLAIGAVSTYLTSNPAVSGWRWAPILAALVFSAQRVLSGAVVTNGTVALMAFLALGASGCAHVDAVVKDVESCVSQDGPQALKDLEQSAAPFIEQVIMCDPDFSASALPACVTAGLEGVAATLGPDGVRFETCVVSTIENDPNALAKQKARARLARMDLVRKGNGR